MQETIPIRGEHIDLDQLLKLTGIASSGGEAKAIIQDGAVQLNGETETRRRKKIYPGDIVELQPDIKLTIEASAEQTD